MRGRENNPFTTGADWPGFAVGHTNHCSVSQRGRSPWWALGAALLLVHLLGGTCGTPDAGSPTTGDGGDQVLDYQPDNPQSNQGDSNTMPDTSPVTLPQLTIQTSVSEGDAPLTVTFTAGTLDGQVLADDASYSWDFGEEAVGSGLQVTHTYPRAGVYAVTLVMAVVVADAPYSASATTSISVRAPRPPAAAQPVGVSTEYDVVQGETLQFVLEATSSDGNTRFTIVSPPTSGTLDVAVGVGLGSPIVTYTPAVGFSGRDTFTFAAYDASSVTVQSAAASQAATVTLKVKRRGILSVSSTEGLSSTGNPGGPFSPASVNYTLTNTGERAINWTATKTQDWVTLSKVSDWLAAGAADTVTVSVDSAANSLASGSYSDVITFINTTNAAGNTTRSAGLTVLAPSGALSVSPASGLAATGNQGGPFAPASLVYTLANTGDQSIDWTAAKTQSWVTLSKASGTLTAKATDTVTVSINSAANSLAAGGYSDTVTFTNATNGSGNTTAGVSLTVIPVPGVLSVASTGGLTSSGTRGGPFSPASLVYTLSNTGGTSINWTAAKTQNWVTLSKAFGTLTAGATDTVTVSINTSANGLAAGTYSDLVTFTNATHAAGNTTRGVSLTVTAVSGILTITPSDGLTSAGAQGGPFTPSSVAYTLTNTGGQPINWTAGKTQSWVTLSKASGTLAAGANDTVTLSLGDSANTLAVGTASDVVTFTNTTNGSGNTTRSAALTVNPLPATVLTPIARWDVVPYQRINAGETLNVGVVAFSKAGIQKVRFTITGQGYSGTNPVDVAAMTLNAQSGVWEYHTPVVASSFASDGQITVNATAVGNDGGTRVLEPLSLTVNPTGTLPQVIAYVDASAPSDPSGDQACVDAVANQTPFKTIGRAAYGIWKYRSANGYGDNADGGVIKIAEATHSLGGTSVEVPTINEWITVTHADGGTRTGTVITAGMTSRIRLFAFRDVTLKSTGQYAYVLTGGTSSFRPTASFWLQSCNLIGSGRMLNGSSPVAAGYQRGYYIDCTASDCDHPAWSGYLCRGMKINNIGFDAFVNVPMIVSCDVVDMGPVYPQFPKLTDAVYYPSKSIGGTVYNYVIEKTGAFADYAWADGDGFIAHDPGNTSDLSDYPRKASAGRISDDAIYLSTAMPGFTTQRTIAGWLHRESWHADGWQWIWDSDHTESNLIVYGFTVEKSWAQGIVNQSLFAQTAPPARDIAFVNVYVSATWNSYWARRTDNILLWNCTFRPWTDGSLGSARVWNWIPDSQGYGSRGYSPVTNLSLKGCVFDGGFYDWYASYPGMGDVDYGDTSDNQFRCGPGTNGRVAPGAAASIGDPQLDSEGQPLATSPVRGKLNDLLVPCDIANKARAMPSSLGAYEYSP